MENFTEDAKKQVIELLTNGEKDRAIRYLQDSFGISEDQANLLVQTLEEETIPTDSNDPEVEHEKAIVQSEHPRRSTSGCVGKILKIISFLFLAAAFFCFAVVAIVYSIQQETVGDGYGVTGTVTGFRYSDDGGAAPNFEYQLNGKTAVYESNIFSTPPSFALNEKVELYINKEKPEEIVVDVFSERWLGIVVLAVAGAFFVILMIVLRFIARRF